MKQRSLLTAFVSLMTTLVAVTTHAESWPMLLPSPDWAPVGYGTSVILDPYPASSVPGVLLAGSRGSDATLDSVARVTPLETAGAAYQVDSLDGAITRAMQVIHNPDDGLYALGSDDVGWKVSRSSHEDQGRKGTWEHDDEFYFTYLSGSGKKKTLTQGLSRAMGATTDPQGRVFVAGYASDGVVNHRIVRFKDPNSNWDTALDLPGRLASSRRESNPITSLMGVCHFPGNLQNDKPAVLAFGILNSQWTILRSQDRGTNWHALEPEAKPWPGDGSAAQVWDAAVDAQGQIYICGVRGWDGNQQGWVVRKSADGGDTWTTLLDKSDGEISYAARIMIDDTSTVWVAGATAMPGSNRTRWVVVRNSLGQEWQDSSDQSDSWSRRVYPLGPDRWSRGKGMVDDGQGHVYLTGDVLDDTATIHVGLLRWVRASN